MGRKGGKEEGRKGGRKMDEILKINQAISERDILRSRNICSVGENLAANEMF